MYIIEDGRPRGSAKAARSSGIGDETERKETFMRKSISALCALGLLVVSCGGPAIRAPSGLTVQGFTTSSVSLAWTDNSDNEDGFRIYRSEDGTTFALLDTTFFPSYQDNAVSESTLYYYRVTAYNATDESASSNTVSVTPEDYYVTLLTPNGGEDLTLGDTYNITWDTNMPGFDATIWLSTNGGSSFDYEIQFSWAPNPQPIPWKVGYRNTQQDPLQPPVWVQVVGSTADQCVIRIWDYNDHIPMDVSNTVFTVTVP